MEPEISVIIPIFNSEDSLRDCISAVLSQSFRNFELLLVDDGSTDSSGSICNEYDLEDERVRVFHQNNQGVSSARNVGLIHATGQWVVFVDADDHVSPRYLEHLYGGISDGITNHILVFSGYHAPGISNRQFPRLKLTKADAAKYVLANRLLSLSAPYAKLFSLEVIRENGISFPEGINMGEDGIFLLEYINAIDAISFIDDLDYTVNSTEGSLSKRFYSFESEWKCYLTWKNLASEYVYKYQSIFSSPNHVVWTNCRVGAIFFRCLVSVAYQQPVWPLWLQWDTLKAIPKEEYINYRQYYHANSLAGKVYQLIVGIRWYLLFLLLANRNRFLWH